MRVNAPKPAGLAVSGAFIILLVSCADSPSLRGLEEHPAVERLMTNTRIVSRSQAIPDSIPVALRAIAERLREAAEMVRFGELDGPQQYVFGDLADVSIIGDTVYVLEPTVGEVRLFTTQGAHLASFGSKGQGPNELADPRDIEFGSTGQLAILERNGIKIFSIEQREMALDRVVVPAGALGGASVCMLSDSLFVVRTRGLRMDKQLHVYTSLTRSGQRDSTELVTRFGDGYPFGSALVRGRLSRGPMACPSPTVAVIAYHDLPLIEAYGINGQQLWQSGLAEFDPVRTLAGVDPEDGAAFIRTSDTAGRHRVQTVTTLPGGFLLVQVSAMAEPANYMEQGTIDSYVFAVDSGLGVFVGDNLPGIKAATDDLLVGGAVTDDMAPQVVIWKY